MLRKENRTSVVISQLNLLVQTPANQKYKPTSVFRSISDLKNSFSQTHNLYSLLSTANKDCYTIILLFFHCNIFPHFRCNNLGHSIPCWISGGSIDEKHKTKRRHNESACRKKNSIFLCFGCISTLPNKTAVKSRSLESRLDSDLSNTFTCHKDLSIFRPFYRSFI